MLVTQIMKAKPAGVATISAQAKVSEAVAELSARRIGALVVSEDGETIAGIISERDIVRELGKRGADVLNDRVEALMTRKIFTCAPEDDAKLVVETMTKNRFRHMPVVSEGKMVGVISIGDVVAARLSELEMETDALTGMIMGN